MEVFKDIVQSVVSFLIVEAFLLNLVSDKTFQKLIKMFCGILLILILLNPIGELLGLSDSVSEAAGKLELDQMLEKYEREIEKGNTELAKYYREEYESAAKAQIQSTVEAEGLVVQSCELGISEDGTNQLDSVRLVVSEQTQNGNVEIKPVEEVVIDSLAGGNGQTGSADAQESVNEVVVSEEQISEDPRYLRIRNEIICMYGVSKEQIEIVEVNGD